MIQKRDKKRNLKPQKLKKFSRKYSLFPLEGKKPAVYNRDQHSTDIYPFESWKNIIKAGTTADNVALVTGKINRILVFDADNEAAVKWCKRHLPKTPLMQRTKRGIHFFFRSEKGIGTTQNKLFPKLDIKGQKGYIRIYDQDLLIRLDELRDELPRIPKKLRKKLKEETKKAPPHWTCKNPFRNREILSALYAIDPDKIDYDSWFRVAATLKMILSSEGAHFVFWHWSDFAKDHHFPEKERDHWWGTVEPMLFSKVIFKWARDEGWRFPENPEKGKFDKLKKGGK